MNCDVCTMNLTGHRGIVAAYHADLMMLRNSTALNAFKACTTRAQPSSIAPAYIRATMSSTIPAPAPNAPVLRARAVPRAFVPHSGTSAAYPVALSSHALAIEPTSRQAYLFGGELKPRQPVGDEVRAIINLDSANPDDEESTRVYTRPRTVEEGAGWPSPRVGATLTADDSGFIYLWGGRGGKEMAPLKEEESSIWRFSTAEKAWERFDTKGDQPEPRSYHTAAYAQGKLYVHAGCPKDGECLEFFSHALRRWGRDIPICSRKAFPQAGSLLCMRST